MRGSLAQNNTRREAGVHLEMCEKLLDQQWRRGMAATAILHYHVDVELRAISCWGPWKLKVQRSLVN